MRSCRGRCSPVGVALLEIGSDQAEAVGSGDRFGHGWTIAVHDDLATGRASSRSRGASSMARIIAVDAPGRDRRGGSGLRARRTSRRFRRRRSMALQRSPITTPSSGSSQPSNVQARRASSCSSTQSSRPGSGRCHAGRRAARGAFLAGRPDDRPRTSRRHRYDAAARRRPTDAGPAPARSRRAARACASPGSDRRQLGERFRPARLDDGRARCACPGRRARADHRRRPCPRRHAVDRRRLLGRIGAAAHPARGRDLRSGHHGGPHLTAKLAAP